MMNEKNKTDFSSNLLFEEQIDPSFKKMEKFYENSTIIAFSLTILIMVLSVIDKLKIYELFPHVKL